MNYNEVKKDTFLFVFELAQYCLAGSDVYRGPSESESNFTCFIDVGGYMIYVELCKYICF